MFVFVMPILLFEYTDVYLNQYFKCIDASVILLAHVETVLISFWGVWSSMKNYFADFLHGLSHQVPCSSALYIIPTL